MTLPENGRKLGRRSQYLKQQMSHPEVLVRTKAQLRELFSDPELDWFELRFNDEYEITASGGAEEARNFIIENMWNVVFPDTPVPPAKPQMRL